MTDETPDIQPVTPSLKSAMRRARLEESERSEVLAELRGAELARLEMLAEELEPVYAQLPDDVDLFDAGVMPGERPRLFVDMIGFVEMGPDKRTYRFIQDTRHGRVIVRETDRADTMVAAITDYIARRMLERERAMASDLTIESAAHRLLLSQPQRAADNATGGSATQPTASQDAATKSDATSGTSTKNSSTTSSPAQTAPSPAAAPAASPAAGMAPRRSALAWLWDTIEFFALFIGFVVMLILVAGAVYFAWTMGDLGVFSKFFKPGS